MSNEIELKYFTKFWILRWSFSAKLKSLLDKQWINMNEYQIAEVIQKFTFKFDNYGSEYDHEK